MVEHVALYILSGSSVKGQAVLDNIRSSDFIDEINSGEGPREECGLYKLIQLVQPSNSSVKLSSEKDVLEYHDRLVKGEETAKADGEDAKWNTNCILIADKEKDDLVLIVEISKGKKTGDTLKARARSSVEVVSLLRSGLLA
ncbi:protein transport protein [Pseudozyma hubeiensis SY62]|uniref:Protein transport protein n=1 Tax=Pseudozyma hubeiensis (strain SY62) TaxID=1305764 RepID=R9P7N7_PSEHS|nr:protein transport protein [Pseudozyma hubeiensis SY62]GAC94130.1 protein transport protein [Pseudozyma hubeiensis SY62]